jgi:hypothetical protein
MRACRNCGQPSRERYCSPQCRLANRGKADREAVADSRKSWDQIRIECKALRVTRKG